MGFNVVDCVNVGLFAVIMVGFGFADDHVDCVSMLAIGFCVVNLVVVVVEVVVGLGCNIVVYTTTKRKK